MQDKAKHYTKEYATILQKRNILEYIEQAESPEEMYYITRIFFEKNKDILSPETKGNVFKNYIKKWGKSEFSLGIEDTEYAEEYKDSKFGKYTGSYNNRTPMTAGFNLEKSSFEELFRSDLIFLSVNFKESDFSGVEFLYGHFENCDLSNIKTGPKTNFNQCIFVKCNIQNVDLKLQQLSETKIYQCDVRGTVFNEKNMKSRYPTPILCFRKNMISICNNETKGLDEFTISDANTPSDITQIQNIDNKEVIEFWTDRANKGEEIPTLIAEVLKSREAAKTFTVQSSRISNSSKYIQDQYLSSATVSFTKKPAPEFLKQILSEEKQSITTRIGEEKAEKESEGFVKSS